MQTSTIQSTHPIINSICGNDYYYHGKYVFSEVIKKRLKSIRNGKQPLYSIIRSYNLPYKKLVVKFIYKITNKSYQVFLTLYNNVVKNCTSLYHLAKVLYHLILIQFVSRGGI
jgi:hypothetical protein